MSVSPQQPLSAKHQAGANRVAGYDIQPAARPAEPVNVLPKSVSLLETNAGPVSSPAVQCPQGNIPSQPVLGDVTCNMPGRSRNEVTPGQVGVTHVAEEGSSCIHDFKSCLQALLSASWPPRVLPARSVTSAAPGESGYWNFGVRLGNPSARSSVTDALPQLCASLNGFLCQLFPGETWNALCVSRNILTSPHKDTANLPGSSNLTVGIGSYSDGGLWVEDQAGTVPQFIPKLGVTLPGKIVTTHHAPFKFPVHLWHCTQPWLGDRWVLTAFTLPGVSGDTLKGLGFPWPQPRTKPPAPVPTPEPCPPSQQAVPSLEVNWGKPSPKGFAHHRLILQPQIPRPPPSSPAIVQSVLQQSSRIFLDICSGAEKPLSSAVQELGFPTLAVDILLDSSMDILDNTFFEQLLFICGSGVVGYCAASPCCSEYSRLKLFGGPPFAIRTPTQLGGLENLSPSAQARIQTSHEMLFRACKCLQIVHGAGGHGHLEQPSGAMSWEESCVQGWLHCGSTALIVLPACAFGENWAKTWLFASSFQALSVMGQTCQHGRNAHESVQGRESDGSFKSRKTAKYPQCLAEEFALHIRPLLAGAQIEHTLATASALVPVKALDVGPWVIHDGAGRHSCGDWSTPLCQDKLKNLRTYLLGKVCDMQGPKRLLAKATWPNPEPLFTASEVQDARTDFFSCLGVVTDANTWKVREHQPLHLHALEALACFCGDPDVSLCKSLLQGVPTGYNNDIPVSNCFWPNQKENLEDVSLSIHMQNWRSASVDLSVTQALLQEELDQGFCFKFDGDIEAAKAKWPGTLAIGKLSVVRAPNRSERLVLDNSVCGTNASCSVPEVQHMPSVRDVMHCFPLRGTRSRQAAISLDVKSAHKRCVVKESEQGLLGFAFADSLYFYRVAPFGAVFAQHWWGRLGSCLLRLLHILIWFSHAGHLFVDDYLFSQAEAVLPATGAMICLFFQILGVPLSWKKLQVSSRVQWIGWCFCYTSGVVSLAEEKRLKLLGMVQDLQRNPKISRKDLERFVGLALWAAHLFPTMKSLLYTFYHDLFSPAATNYSVAPDVWPQLRHHLTDSLQFKSVPPGTAIPLHSTLLSVRHQDLSSLADLDRVRITDRRVWMRVSSQSSSKRKLSTESVRILGLFEHWLLHMCPFCSMRPLGNASFEARADASAHGSMCCIGGYVSHPMIGQRWFRESFSYSAFRALEIPVQADMQLDIACYEALAQGALILATSSLLPCARIPLQLRSASDNTGAEAGVNASFSTARPLCFFLERISLLAAVHRTTLDVSHISGERNVKADALSRPAEYEVPPDCLEKDRVRLSLEALWLPRPNISVFPEGAHLPWSVRSRGVPNNLT